MSTIERIEYWSSCPSCGAPRRGNDFECSYCGTSLVKEREILETDETVEDAIAREDGFLPQLSGKNCAVSTFAKLFCPLFGGTFLFVSITCTFAFYTEDLIEPWVMLTLLPFYAVGVGSLLPLIIPLYRSAKCRSGQLVYGTVRGY